MDWTAWHVEYDQPGSRLARRLRVVQDLLATALDRAAPGPVRLLSACAGEGRDVLGVLPRHRRGGEVRALLVEADPDIAARAAAGAEAAGLGRVTVAVADAGRAVSYAPIVPAEVLLFCGVFGNISPGDICRTILELPSLAAPGARVIWTRGRDRNDDPTGVIRRWFDRAGFVEEAFVAPEDEAWRAGRDSFSVGLHRLAAAPGEFDPGARLFSFQADRQGHPERAAPRAVVPADGSPSILGSISVPIVQAPMAGGPSTPALAIAVTRGGGLGFLAAGYLPLDRLEQDLEAARGQIDRFGVNLFVPGGRPARADLVAAYAERLRPEAERSDVSLGEARFDDDRFDEKVALLERSPVAVVSFTFGIPPGNAVERLRSVGSEVWLTVTSPQEARLAAAAGADALIVQGVEAGGHRGVFEDDDEQPDLSLLAALQLVARVVDLPLVGAGSIMTGSALAAVLVAGASAGQVGTAYIRAPEAGTSDIQRDLTATDRPTVLTRAFSGRTARGIVNRFHERYGADAPRAYPEVHHITSPLRARGRAVGDPELINLWAGQAHSLAEALPAEEITRRLAHDARQAIDRWAIRLG
jgi:nitronate monooxygenase